MAVDRWTNTSGGLFSVADDWSLDRVPGLTDDALVDLAGSYSISTNAVFALGSLNIAQSGVILLVQTPGSTNTVAGDVVNSGSVDVDPDFRGGGSAVTVTGTFTNSGRLTLGAQFDTLSADDSITAAHIVNTGTIDVDGATTGATAPRSLVEDTGDLAPVSLDATLLLAGHSQFDYGAGGQITTIGSGGTLRLGSAYSRLTSSGDASGNTALSGLASNAGQLTLTGAVVAAAADADFANSGTLSVGNGGSIGTRRNITNSGNLQVDPDFDEGGTAVTVTGTLTNSGQLTLGAAFNTLSADDSITAAHIVNTGTLYVQGATTGATAPRSLIEDTDDAAPTTLDANLLLTGHARFDYGAGGQITAIGSGGTLRLGSAYATLTSAGDASGNTALSGLASNAGTLTLTGAALTAALGADFTNTGTLSIGDGGSIGTRRNITNSGYLQVAPYQTDSGTAATITGVLTNTGTLDLGFTFNGVSANASITAGAATNTGSETVATGATLSVTGTAAYSQAGGTTRVDGTLASGVSLTGGVLDGTGVVTGNVSNTGGTIRGGDQTYAPGTLTIAGELTEGNSSILEEDLAGAAAASELLVTSGTAALGGTLQINAQNGFTPAVGQFFIVLAAAPGQLSGRFTTLRYGSTLGNGTYVAVAPGVYLTVAYDYAAGTVTLQAVTRPPSEVADPQISPTSIAFGNVHLGDAGTQALTVANTAASPADSLDISVASLTGGAVATGSVSRLVPASSDTSDIRVGIDTTSVGIKDGQAVLALSSDSGGGVMAPLASQSVAVTGSVYRLASPLIDPVNAFVHVGDPGTFALTIRNADPADGYSETLDARVTGYAGRVIASGATALTLAPGVSSGSSILISAPTGSVGIQSGTVSLAFVSDGGTGAGSLDGLGVTTLASQTLGVSVTVDNYAVPEFTLLDADGLSATIAGSGTAETLDLGTIARGSGLLVLRLGVNNAATGPADLLAGTILASGSSTFTASGLDAFAGLGAGQTDGAPTVTLDTSADGSFTETLSVDGTGSNASGYSGALARRTLTITGTVADLPTPTITGLNSLTAITGIDTSLGSIRVQDVDADGSLTVTISATGGILSAAPVQGVVESGSASGLIVLAGDQTALNGALSSLTFTGSSNNSGLVTVSVLDRNHASASASATIDVQPIPSTATVLTVPSQIMLGISTTPTALVGLSVTNPSAQASGKTISVQIKSVSGLILGETGNSGAAITGQGTSVLTLTGTVDQINADLADPPTVGDYKDLLDAENDFIQAYKAPFDIIASALGGDVDPTSSDKSYDLAVNLVNKLFPLLKAIYEISSKFDEAEELGDAHLVSFKGELLSFNAAGEFTLAKSTQSGSSFAVQARTQPVPNSVAATIITQVAAQLGTDRITIDATRSSSVFVNGIALAVSPGTTITLAGGQLAEVAAGAYQITWNSGEVLSLGIVGQHIDVALGLGAGDAPGTVIGLLGRNDNPGTSFVLPDGTSLPTTLTSSQLYNALGDAWRVTDATSLFDYEGGKTTASYTDTSFPRLQLSLSDLPAEVVAKAAAAAVAAGVTDPNAMLVGEEDYILTGDPSYLAGAQNAIGGSSVTAAIITPSAPTPAVLGVLADTMTVVTAADGSANGVFDVYLTKPSGADTLVNYAVVLAASGDLDPAAFGTAPTTGSITIGAGQTSGQVTIAVPAGALGSATSQILAIRISSADVLVYAPDALTQIVEPVAGPPPVVSISEQTTLGTLTRSGNSYSLDVGAVSYGESLPLIRFAVANTAAGADQLGGSFAVAPSYGFTVAGTGALTPITAGQSYTGLTVALNQNKFGANSETITFNPTDSNPSGYAAPLDPVTLNISYTLEAPTMAYSQAWGDVHIITYNNLKYDFQAVGEFVLAHSTIAGDNFDIQLRLSPYASSSSVSVITEVALKIGADRVTFGLDRATTVWLNGVPSTVSAGSPTLNLAGGSVTALSDSTFKVTWATGETATITDNGTFFNVTDGVPAVQFGAYSGLQGEDEGQANDFQLADGTVVPQPLAASTLYGKYANSWRVSQATSLFDYGQGETTDTYTDRGFPRAPVQLSTLPADVQARAAAAVAAAGITDPGIGAAAALDYIATGDPAFIAAAAVAQQQAGGTTAATITQDLPATPQIGVNATVASLIEAASGPTSVVFTVLLTQVSSSDTVVTYAVVAPDASDLAAASFGGTLPSGQVTIAAGQTMAQLTIAVPQGALGVTPTAGLEVQVSSTDQTPIFAPTARTTIVNDQAEAGPPAMAQVFNLGDGQLTRSGNTITLDLGLLTQGQLSPNVNLAIGNIAAAPADLLSGSFSPPLGSGFILIGNNLPAPIAAGAMYSGIYARADTGILGSHSETLTFSPIDENASGYQQGFAPLTLIVEDEVVAAASATLLTPSTIVFRNARIGTTENQAVSIANTGPAGGAALSVMASANGNATEAGSVVSLAAGAVDSSSIRVGLDTSSAGARGGSVVLQPASLLAGSTVAAAEQPSIAVFGSVYRPATASIAPVAAVFHVGDAGLLALGVTNTDAADGFSEDLRATLTSVTGPFGATVGQSTGAIAAGTASRALTLSFSTAVAAQLMGSASVGLVSDGSGVDGIGTLALASQTAPLSVTVNNYAAASLHLLAGSGTLTTSGTAYMLDLGTLAQGTTPVTATLGVQNAATGRADLLSGHFATSSANLIGLSGFGDFAGLAAGQEFGGLSVSLDTSGAGAFSRTLTLMSAGSNASGYSAALADETLTITGTVTATGGGTIGGGSAPGNSTSANTTPVYRFFDSIYGTHLFTQSRTEAQTILANRPDLVEETNNFGAVSPQSGAAAAPVYRFFETTNGTHFFTASYQEFLGLTTASSSTYRSDLTYEANSTFYEDATPQTGDIAVYRFFDTAHGTQFLTGSQSEYTGLTTAGSSTYRPDLTPEGIAFYAPPGSFLA